MIQAGAMARGGANPGGDVAIEITGLRPGEKLFEELLIDGEVTETVHPRVWQMKEGAPTQGRGRGDRRYSPEDGRLRHYAG